ncbi:DUF3558 domain-containing protein [Amycolatopsis methanolica]|uniref:DUF3558 domain-containing protein n=1 Tax=Amycolatopsis methanolica 239 TaxID=1068978 RepID=A0A076N745_AMYME|nr:DUF3558 domain-containing protein [Amycolatopsis methanolica]AIJ27111.1 hypothetical protein AMETH_7019 [Amycolatopsis methanolica 239]
MIRTCLAAATVAAATLLTGCSSSGGTAAAPSTAPSIDPSLRVPAPLAADALAGNPCAGLSDGQASAIGLATPGEVIPGQTGSRCQWQSAAHDANKIFISPLAVQDNGLTGVYATRGASKYFEPTTVAGYPAVYADNADLRPNGSCALWVGVTDQLAVGVTSSILVGPNATNPCPIVEEVAVAMVQHLKGDA